MNKICTTIEQSKRLIELGIDVNTADMYWWSTTLRSYIEAMDDGDFNEAEGHIPAWSLSALMELMPIETHLYKMQDENDYTKHYYKVGSADNRGWIEFDAESAIDAAFEMVCWLKEQKCI